MRLWTRGLLRIREIVRLEIGGSTSVISFRLARWGRVHTLNIPRHGNGPMSKQVEYIEQAARSDSIWRFDKSELAGFVLAEESLWTE